MLEQEVIENLRQHFTSPDDLIYFIDEKGDMRHFFLKIISDSFAELNRIQRSQKVYAILNDYLKKDHIHALRMELKTHNEIKHD